MRETPNRQPWNPYIFSQLHIFKANIAERQSLANRAQLGGPGPDLLVWLPCPQRQGHDRPGKGAQMSPGRACGSLVAIKPAPNPEASSSANIKPCKRKLGIMFCLF